MTPEVSHALEIGAAVMLVLALGYLIELARENGALLRSLAVVFLLLVAGLIAAAALWNHFVELPALLH